jgi:hypothetical protein
VTVAGKPAASATLTCVHRPSPNQSQVKASEAAARQPSATSAAVHVGTECNKPLPAGHGSCADAAGHCWPRRCLTVWGWLSCPLPPVRSACAARQCQPRCVAGDRASSVSRESRERAAAAGLRAPVAQWVHPHCRSGSAPVTVYHTLPHLGPSCCRCHRHGRHAQRSRRQAAS